ncbi:TPA: DUF262 domain-containing protein [Pseudomonas aeruginosa]|uniref:DUF262 domain-containing protein n=1 Tax=Pseudomonas aeruginosa TaxID=287 RepID=UPI000F530D85|nr:DUF262 domain-containing protein [Pseudomonas aeruginosa]MBM2720787.1 DUF262 domain-containing protein [Pseudomonas aeruginosa]MEB5352621.1 DUF262 domain-containing protein [Pseudomonas aeruginosa]RQC67906.1 hypothetical protein IPC355_29375 [Pseudomonas aeruginosa]HBP5443640.1 DUF262 domain-containing protein [Pseudomonas aeruginosa]HCI3977123.1 DUF262 domain-containing protein [Pseudomonas aeruginosa]
MKLESKDLIIRTLVSQIAELEIDLEPDFQRGEVWNTQKKQMLIDTIIRNWQMPPIFVVLSGESGLKEVLDGHQRLTSIYDFCENKFKIDGNIQPEDNEIESLNGLYYKDLPEVYKRRIQNYPIRVFEITDYNQSEPFELFYRLNQSVKLTSAERRNTFYGKIREQVKNLVEQMDCVGYNRDTIGFSNTRLSYHDVIVRVLLTLEAKSLEKITDIEITNRYRSHEAFSDALISEVSKAISLLISGIIETKKVKLSKPSLFSLLAFTTENITTLTKSGLKSILENYRTTLATKNSIIQNAIPLDSWLLKEYTYRLSTSVNDTKSVILRRFFLFYLAYQVKELTDSDSLQVSKTIHLLNDYITTMTTEEAYEILIHQGWGKLS